jgi:hypothetical protein
LDYIKSWNGLDWDYFPDYVGGTVTIYSDDEGDVYSTPIRNKKKPKKVRTS